MLFDWLDYFFPRFSVTGREGEWCTAAELSAIPVQPGHETKHDLRRSGLQYLDELWWLTPYSRASVLAQALHAIKYRHRPQLAALLCHHLHPRLPELPLGARILPVPLHWFRQFQRGFNQAELIAALLADRNSIQTDVLSRRRSTGHQARRCRQERLTAMTNAFSVRRAPPANVILIDDVATTGATLDACAQTLKSAGTMYVGACVLARG